MSTGSTCTCYRLRAPGVQMFDADTATDLGRPCQRPHGAGYWPRAENAAVDERNISFATSSSRPAAWRIPWRSTIAIKCVGIDNVLWAIDYPYQPMKPGGAVHGFRAGH